MALKKNKVKFGLNKVHWAKITAWSDDGVPTFATPVRLPGAVSLSIDANGENDNFYADNTVYYVINNNAGYEGDLEVALITTDFATAILGEVLDSKGVLVESNDAETSQFALLFEFDGDKNHIRHVLYCCSASRPATEGETTEESKSVKTETLSLKATALPSGLVKSKTCESTDETTYNNWYNSVYIPTAATTNNSTGTRSASATKSSTAASTTTTDSEGNNMAIKKIITVDGIEVPFKASATLPRLYRAKFRKDIFKDFAALKNSVDGSDEENSGLGIESLEVFENIAYIMAKHADPEGVPDNPDEWLEAFNTFSIYEVLPQLIELWGLNVETQAESKKNIAKLTAR